MAETRAFSGLSFAVCFLVAFRALGAAMAGVATGCSCLEVEGKGRGAGFPFISETAVLPHSNAAVRFWSRIACIIIFTGVIARSARSEAGILL